MAEILHVAADVSDNGSSSSTENESPQKRVVENQRLTLKFLIQPIMRLSLSSDVYRQTIMLNTTLSDAFLDVFVTNLESLRNAQHLTDSASASTIGQLTKFNWTAGVAVKSNQASRLMVPYVRMKLDVSQNTSASTSSSQSSDVASQVQTMSMELTLKEFQVLLMCLRDFFARISCRIYGRSKLLWIVCNTLIQCADVII